MNFLFRSFGFQRTCRTVAWIMWGTVLVSVFLNATPIVEGLQDSKPGWPLAWFSYVTPVFLYLLALTQVGVLFQSLGSRGAFDKASIFHLKRLSVILIVYGLVRGALAAFTLNYMLGVAWRPDIFPSARQLALEQFLAAAFPFALALSMNVLATAFGEGSHLKQEAELTI